MINFYEEQKTSFFELEVHKDDGETVLILSTSKPRKGTVIEYTNNHICYQCKVIETPIRKENLIICQTKVISIKGTKS